MKIEEVIAGLEKELRATTDIEGNDGLVILTVTEVSDAIECLRQFIGLKNEQNARTL
jgi:hypothetical protein